MLVRIPLRRFWLPLDCWLSVIFFMSRHGQWSGGYHASEVPTWPVIMTDTLSPSDRSRRMAAVRSIDTKPEMIVRKLVHGMGYRYRLHGRDLPGTPDMVFPSRRSVIFVHGCFWHRHEHCRLARLPKSRLEFWAAKLEGNRARDERKVAELRAQGWRVLVVWECELKDRQALVTRLKCFLDGGGIG